MGSTYPVISWDVEIKDGENAVVVTANGVTETLHLLPGTYRGLSYSGASNLVGSYSLAYEFAVMLTTHSEIDSSPIRPHVLQSELGNTLEAQLVSGATVIEYQLLGPGLVPLSSASIDWSNVLSTAPAALFGWTPGVDVALSYVSIYTTQNIGGVFAPPTSDNLFDLRNLSIVGSSSQAISASTEGAHSARELGSVYRGSLTYDRVDDAYIRLYRAEDTECGWVSNAYRLAGDPHNLLENLVTAAAEGKVFSLLDPSTSVPRFQFVVPPPWDIGALSTAAGRSGVRYTVVIPLRVVT